MNRITEGNTKNFLALTIVATIAAIFMIPVGLASANHDEGLSGTIDKTNNCPNPMTVNTDTQCTITITYTGENAILKDTVPAGWDVTQNSKDALEADGCSVEASNKPKPSKSNNGVGSTKIICSVVDTDTIDIEIDTRTTKKGKQKPTSCGEDVFEVNGGAVALADINQDGVPDLFEEHDDLGDPTGNFVTLELASADPEFVDVEGCVED